MEYFSNLAGTMASKFRIAKGGPTIIPGSSDPNTGLVGGSPGDIYIRTGGTPSVFLNQDGNVWMALSTEQQLVRTKVTASVFIANNDCLYLGVRYNGAVSIYLPAGSDNKRFIVKDELGQALDNPITIMSYFGDTIDGQNQYRLSTAYESVSLIYGDEWHLF